MLGNKAMYGFFDFFFGSNVEVFFNFAVKKNCRRAVEELLVGTGQYAKRLPRTVFFGRFDGNVFAFTEV